MEEGRGERERGYCAQVGLGKQEKEEAAFCLKTLH